MNNRLLPVLALLLFFVACLAIQQIDWNSSNGNVAFGILIGEPESGLVAMAPPASELVLARTPDAEFLREPVAPANEVAETPGQVAEAAAAAEPGAESDGKSVAMEGDGKEVREPEIAGADGKEFKETLDAKWLPPIAEGEATEGGVGGGGGLGGGGGGGGPANEVAAFTEVREVEKESDTIVNNTTPTVINETIIRTVPQVPPVVPVPEPGSALTGFGVAAVVFASLLRRRRPGVVL